MWNDALLTELLNVTDPVADQAVKSFLEDKTDKKAEIMQVFDLLVTNSDPVPDALPEPLKHYFNSTEALPAWYDGNLARRGQKVFSEYGPLLMMLLGYKALPQSYACGNGADVLLVTGRLNAKGDDDYTYLARRLIETSQFVMNVMDVDSFTPGGKGIRTAQKIRLIHASIRGYLAERGWQPKSGLPINQTYIAGTLMAFSMLCIDGLGQLGIQLSREDKQAYLHCWKVVGHYVGLDERLLTDDPAEAQKLGDAIFASQLEKSDSGIILTRALLNYYNSLLPGNVLGHSPADIMAFFLGEHVSGILEIKPGFFGSLVQMALRFSVKIFTTIENDADFFRHIVEKNSRRFIEALLGSLNPQKQVRFEIPPSLKRDWGV